MRKLIRCLLVSLWIAPTLLPCSAPPERKKREFPAAKAGNAFALDLYGRIASEKRNLIFSPHIVHTALAMALGGARGTTAEEMARVLRLPVDPAQAAPAYHDFLSVLRDTKLGSHELYQLVFANALWGQEGCPFRQDYLDLLKVSYGGELYKVDFVKAGDAARRTINAWVGEQTLQKIPDLIPPGSIFPNTRLVLANAVYLKSAWQEKFATSETRNEAFYLADGTDLKIPLMRNVNNFDYTEGESFQMVSLPYQGMRLAMIVLLPKEKDQLPALETKLTTESLAGWISELKVRKVHLFLPRFRMASDLALSGILKTMGLTAAFVYGETDFSGMVSAKNIFIAEVFHKACLDLNEEGTEAAAAAGTLKTLGGISPKEERPVVFRADHPFLFLIHHWPTGAILFIGRLADPLE